MKKALIIANMLFASATVFGMDQVPIPAREFSTSGQSRTMAPVSSAKDKFFALFKTAQSQLKDNQKLSEDTRLFFSNLEFEAVWEEIERIYFSDSSSENARQSANVKEILSRLNQIFGENSSEAKNMKTLLNSPEASFRQIVKAPKFEDSLRQKAIESAGKRGAKLFYKDVLRVPQLEKDLHKLEQVLGIPGLEEDLREIERGSETSESGSELAKYLYRRAIYDIDSAECIPGSSRDAIVGSQNSSFSGIRCGYYDYDDLLLVLTHETGHCLDWAYRIRKMFGGPITKIVEKLHLLENRRFFGFLSALCMSGCSQQSEYVSMFFESLLRSSRFRGNLYPEDSSAHRFRLLGCYGDFIGKGVICELTDSYNKDQLSELLSKDDKYAIIRRLRKNDLFNRYIEVIIEEPRVFLDKNSLTCDLSENQKQLWNNCLLLMEGRDECQELRKYLFDIDKRKRNVLGHGSISDRAGTEHYLQFSKNLLEVEDPSVVRELCPKLEGIDWHEIFTIALQKGSSFERALRHHINQLKEVIEWKGLTNILKNLRVHQEGKYNSFCLIKEKGYFNALERGESLPTEEFMGKLTERTNTFLSRFTVSSRKKYIKEFFEFLKN